MSKIRKLPDMNLPVWFDSKNINEALFCEEFLHERRIIFANGAFFTPDGRVTDALPLRGEIYEKLKCCAVNNIPRKISNILGVMKLEAQVEDFPPEQDRIHLSNGTLLLDGTFTEGRPEIVRNRLPVAYRPDTPEPVLWLRFLSELLLSLRLSGTGCRSFGKTNAAPQKRNGKGYSQVCCSVPIAGTSCISPPARALTASKTTMYAPATRATVALAPLTISVKMYSVK